MNRREELVRRKLLRISEVESSAAAHSRFRQVAERFMRGYRVALECEIDEVVEELGQSVEGFWQPYAWEGVGFAFGMLSLLEASSASLLERAVAFHPAESVERALVLVGVGWALARLDASASDLALELDAAMLDSVSDGCGFHVGYFAPWRFAEAGRIPRRTGFDEGGFDRGVGRSLWFVHAGDPELSTSVEGFEPERRPTIWGGVGLACGFTGGASRDSLAALRGACTDLAALRRGVEFGIELRRSTTGVTPDARAAAAVFLEE